MKQRDVSLSKSFVFGILSAMFVVFIYGLVIIALYFLVLSESVDIFISNLVLSAGTWIWVWLGASILYGFTAPISILMQDSPRHRVLAVVNTIFFITTVIVTCLAISYIKGFRAVFDRAEIIFYMITFSLIIAIVSIHLSVGLRNSIYIVYEFLLSFLGYNSSGYWFKVEERSFDEHYFDKMAFISSAESVIAFAGRTEASMGIIGFKISDSDSLLEQYGDEGYNAIERQLVSAIREQARAGEGQCYVQGNIVYSLLYANEDEALKSARRYFQALKAYGFRYDAELISVSVVVAVAGLDFSNKKSTARLGAMFETLMARVGDAVLEAQETETPVVYYG